MALPDDMVLYASANMPSDDSATSGGAIDPDSRLVFVQPVSVPASIEVVSSAAGDTTQQLTVRGRNTLGAIVTQTVTLTGTTAVDLTTLGQVELVLKASLNSDCTGTVTVRTDGAVQTIGEIPPGERSFVAVHREGQASAAEVEDFYYKGFWKNTGAGTLTTPVVSETDDPASRATFALAATVNDSASVANRKTAPALTFDNNPKNVPASLTPGDAIGVWFKFSHPVADGTQSTTVSSQISGGS